MNVNERKATVGLSKKKENACTGRRRQRLSGREKRMAVRGAQGMGRMVGLTRASTK